MLSIPPRILLARRAPTPAAAVLALLAAAVLAVALLPGAGAASNRGTIKVHDEADADPATRNEPHVDCEDFWVQGLGMAGDGGSLRVWSWPPTGGKERVISTAWDGEEADGGKGFDFLAGPFTLPPGHYRVEADDGDGHGGAKAKMFWVEPCPEEPEPTPSETSTGTTTRTETSATTTTAPPHQRLACPSGVRVAVQADGTAIVSFTPAPGSDGTNVYRADGDGDFGYVGTAAAGEGSFTDPAPSNGTRTYLATALFGVEESQGCAAVEAAAIPEFPTAMALGLASAGGLAALAHARRRLR